MQRHCSEVRIAKDTGNRWFGRVLVSEPLLVGNFRWTWGEFRQLHSAA